MGVAPSSGAPDSGGGGGGAFLGSQNVPMRPKSIYSTTKAGSKFQFVRMNSKGSKLRDPVSWGYLGGYAIRGIRVSRMPVNQFQIQSLSFINTKTLEKAAKVLSIGD